MQQNAVARLPLPVLDRGRWSMPNGVGDREARAVLKWATTRKPARWPKVLEVEQQRPDNDRVGGGSLSVHWIGHSTALIQVENLNLLTDPIWSARCSPLSFAGPKRVSLPGIKFEHLPPIDVVVISHDHYDHLDRPTIRRLVRAHDPLFCVPSGLTKTMRRLGARRIEARSWWESVDLPGGCKVISVPAQHWSGRTPTDRGKSLWCGWILQTEGSGEVLFVGDTGWWEAGYQAIGREFQAIRMALIPIGAYEPRWFMGTAHVGADEAVDLFDRVGTEHALAIHHATFQLTDEAVHAPAELLAQTLNDRSIPAGRFRTIGHGQCWNL